MTLPGVLVPVPGVEEALPGLPFPRIDDLGVVLSFTNARTGVTYCFSGEVLRVMLVDLTKGRFGGEGSRLGAVALGASLGVKGEAVLRVEVIAGRVTRPCGVPLPLPVDMVWARCQVWSGLNAWSWLMCCWSLLVIQATS